MVGNRTNTPPVNPAVGAPGGDFSDDFLARRKKLRVELEILRILVKHGRLSMGRLQQRTRRHADPVAEAILSLCEKGLVEFGRFPETGYNGYLAGLMPDLDAMRRVLVLLAEHIRPRKRAHDLEVVLLLQEQIEKREGEGDGTFTDD